MGAFTTKTSDIIDSITDIIAVKTGIILNRTELLELISEDNPALSERLQIVDSVIRFRSEAFDELLSNIRFKIGDVADTRPPFAIILGLMMPWDAKGYDTNFWQNKVLKMMQKIGPGENGMVNPTSIILELVEQDKLPIDFVRDLMHTFIVNQERSNTGFLNESDAIIHGTRLEDLFNNDISDTGEKFIAQKFINYLAANPDKIQNIHWRNFENFCATYFDRLGFTVELGPGRNDGGIDIVIKDPENNLINPLIIVQCKRYKNSNDVSIEAVKSFSTDVTFTGAKIGIIATTSRIAPGGKAVTIERKFPLEFVEAEGIKDWALTMSNPK